MQGDNGPHHALMRKPHDHAKSVELKGGRGIKTAGENTTGANKAGPLQFGQLFGPVKGERIMTGSRSAYTRAQILHTATRLFVRKGPDGTLLREITAAAGVNLSAVHYHFGSKEGLIQAVYQQQLANLNRERLALLEQFETQANGDPIKPCQIVKAFFLPLLQYASLHHTGHKVFIPLLNRAGASPQELLHRLITNDEAGTIERFRTALRRALPGMPEQEILWRWLFMLGATSCAMNDMEGPLLALNGSYQPSDKDHVSKRLIPFLTAGLQAPLSTPPELPA